MFLACSSAKSNACNPADSIVQALASLRLVDPQAEPTYLKIINGALGNVVDQLRRISGQAAAGGGERLGRQIVLLMNIRGMSAGVDSAVLKGEALNALRFMKEESADKDLSMAIDRAIKDVSALKTPETDPSPKKEVVASKKIHCGGKRAYDDLQATVEVAGEPVLGPDSLDSDEEEEVVEGEQPPFRRRTTDRIIGPAGAIENEVDLLAMAAQIAEGEMGDE